MKVRVLLFALARQLAGSPSLDFELGKGTTVRELRAALAESLPQLSGLLKNTRIAINAEYVDEETALQDRDEVALILPVSGG